MDILKARIASFSKTSKRTKSLNKSTTGALKWPHPTTYKATPGTLAEAGFYYKPSSEFRDNVTCFMCEKELADWDEDDDPFAIHWDKCTSSCAWAMVRCSLMLDLSEDGSYRFANATRLPSSKAMEKARLETYTMHAWPHDSVKGHGAGSKKMAKAGFVYTPQAEGDDTATCFYCGISLSGWDHTDDPLEEHRKREERTHIACPFFTATANSSTLSKSTSKAPSRVSSKPPSRTISQSRIKAPHVAPLESKEESSDEDEPAPPPSNFTGSIKGKRSTVSSPTDDTGTTSAARRSTRGKSARGKVVEASDDDDVDVEESGSEAGKKLKAKRKGKTPSKARMESVQEEEGHDENQDIQDEPEPPKPRRGRPPGSKKPTTSTSTKKKSPTEDDDVGVDAVVPSAASSTKPKHTRVRSKTNFQSDVEQQDPVPLQAKSTTRSGKGTRTRAPRLAESVAEQSGSSQRKLKSPNLESQPEDITSKSAPKGRIVSRSKTKPSVPQDDLEDESVPSSHSRLHQLPSPKRTASGSRQQEHSPNPPGPDRSQTKTRKSSSTSDDAGYATAELPMDVDEMTGPQHSTSRPNLEEYADILMVDGHDRDSGLAESVGPSSPSHVDPSRNLSVAHSTQNELPTEKAHDSAASVVRRELPSSPRGLSGPIRESKVKKGKEKMQVEVLMRSPPRGPPSSAMADMDTDDDQVQSTQFVRRSEGAATPPPSTSSSSPSFHADPSTPKSKTVQFLATIEDPDPPPASSEAGLPDSLTPLLAVMPMEKLISLTEEESAMTIEQYIRREIESQYQRFKEDGELKIAQFKEKAAETRRIIEAS